MSVFRLATVLSATLFATACSSSAPDPAPIASTATAQPATTAQAATGDDRVVCKEIRKTGTRFGTRQCLTVAQWEAIRRGAEEGVDEIQRRASHQQDMPGQGG